MTENRLLTYASLLDNFGELNECIFNRDARLRQVAKAQDQKTAEQIYKEIGEWLEKNKYVYTDKDALFKFPRSFIARLKQGLPPEETK